MKARRTLRSLGEGGSGRGFREFRKIPRSLLRGASLIKAPDGTNLYMDPASDATEEYYASTPALAGSLLEIRPPVGHTPTPHLRRALPGPTMF